MRPGDWAQIEAENGAGKSCFMKAVGGEYLWAYGRGTVARNEHFKTMYATQDIELQNITFRQLVTYPDREELYSDHEIQNVLGDVGLQKFMPHLDQTCKDKDGDSWDRTLSGGEKQKLVLARMLLQKPDILFLDEANSAMDVEAKGDFYRLLKEKCPDAIVIAVLHEAETPCRKNGQPYFNQRLIIEDGIMMQKRREPVMQPVPDRWPKHNVYSPHVMKQICQSPHI
ncbi:MAG: hypothetical protein DI626_09880 [Micavibrio aeruginosavorus]|uniref:ABC transporter domain-containing protein n=1 Tax=Micavibrio aeruginosavorus TaxID=349221 RepID=A0A2W4ZK24_9BACT|nr:MAG: hypothetical protein DI626_09880 [Micavibrio aeruginosavorus]